jgi:proteasome lid subunit RPN8/RPN11
MLKISQSALEDLRRHGEQTYPNECCGVLVGKLEGEARRVSATAHCANTRSDSPQDRYNIDPKELVRVQREARERGEDVVGFYHSHPDNPARWSKTDLAEAHWIGCSYVITAIEGGLAGRTCSFELAGTGEEDKRFLDEEIEPFPSVAAVAPA